MVLGGELRAKVCERRVRPPQADPDALLIDDIDEDVGILGRVLSHVTQSPHCNRVGSFGVVANDGVRIHFPIMGESGRATWQVYASCMFAALLTLLSGISGPTNNRLYVADASSFDEKLGFYISFENQSQAGPCSVETLKPFLGVADGRAWRFVTTGDGLKIGDTLHITAKITSTGAEFGVNGHVIKSPGGFKPAAPKFSAATVPDWANGPTQYRLVEKALSVTVNGVPKNFSLPSGNLSPVLSLLESPEPVKGTVAIEVGDTVFIDATVQVAPRVNIKDYQPILDVYSQLRQADYPGKISSDLDLKAAFQADDQQLAAWPPRSDVDAFGGTLNTDLARKGTGFYATVKHDGFWWLQTPLGNPAFYTGVSTAPAVEWDSTPVTAREELFSALPPRAGLTPSLWARGVWGSENIEQAAVHALNLIKRFGEGNFDAKAKEECRQRIAAWGFTGLGKWSQELPKTPILPVISLPDIPKIDRHFDVYDAHICAKIQDSLDRQLSPNRDNPYILGYSFGNEYDEIITPAEILHILGSKAASPAKLALIDFATKHLYGGSSDNLRFAWGIHNSLSLDKQQMVCTPTDLEPLREAYATQYYSTLYHSFKTADPNHLYFGFWIVPGWWVNDKDWDLIAQNVDVIGFDRYADWPGIENLLTRFDKPVLLGEFSFPAWYGGTRGFGRYSLFTETDAESGKRYSTLVNAAAKCPQCVGTMWFQYRDEPITGRGPVEAGSVAMGEHYAFGLIDAKDLPKYDLVKPVRQTNLLANQTRLKSMKSKSKD